jgi:hypothetical protein
MDEPLQVHNARVGEALLAEAMRVRQTHKRPAMTEGTETGG